MIAYFSNERFLGSADCHPIPSHHFFCPACGSIWARVISEPGDHHRIIDTLWCPSHARTTPEGALDGIIDVHYFAEISLRAPKEVLIHNFMQAYDNRLRLENAGVEVVHGMKYRLHSDRSNYPA